MKKLGLALLLAVLGLAPAQAQPINQYVAAGAYPFIAKGYCQITSLGAAVALVTASCSTGSVPANTGNMIVEVCVETAGIRYRDDGTNPTATLGMPIVGSATSPSCFQYSASSFAALKFIAISGSPVINVLFYAGGTP